MKKALFILLVVILSGCEKEFCYECEQKFYHQTETRPGFKLVATTVSVECIDELLEGVWETYVSDTDSIVKICYLR